MKRTTLCVATVLAPMALAMLIALGGCHDDRHDRDWDHDHDRDRISDREHHDDVRIEIGHDRDR